MFKKALFTFLTLGVLATSVLSFLAPQAHAQNPTYQGPWYFQGPIQWYTKVYDTSNQQDIFGERYTAAQVQWVIYSIFSIMITTFTGPDIPICIFTGDVTGACTTAFRNLYASSEAPSNLADKNQSLLSAVFLSPRPMSGIGYFREKAVNLHIVPQAYAQSGFGYGSLSFIQTMWQSTRDIMYALMILIIIAMAFMIMFRTKVSPQAVITVQSALPKVIITLILVTFSYAIAGFAIDLMYVVIGIMSLLLSQSGIFIQPINPANPQPINMLPVDIFNIFLNGANGLGSFGDMFLYWIHFIIALVGIVFSPTTTAGGFFGFVQGVSASFVGMIIGIIIFIIVTIFMLIVTFKVLWMLVKTFINIILGVIAGPLIIGFGAISKNGGGFSGWLKTLLSNLAVYPITGLLFWVSYIFLGAAYYTGGIPPFIPAGTSIDVFHVNPDLFTNPGAIWTPPMTIGNGNVNALRFLWLFVSLGIIAIIPKTVEMIQSVMAGKPFAYGSAIGEVGGHAKSMGGAGAEQYVFGPKARGAVAAGGQSPAWVNFGRKALGIKA